MSGYPHPRGIGGVVQSRVVRGPLHVEGQNILILRRVCMCIYGDRIFVWAVVVGMAVEVVWGKSCSGVLSGTTVEWQ